MCARALFLEGELTTDDDELVFGHELSSCVCLVVVLLRKIRHGVEKTMCR